MSQFNPAGYQPAFDPRGSQHLTEWLRDQVAGGSLDPDSAHFRRPMFDHSLRRYGIVWETYVWNYVNMRVAQFPSKGYIQLLRSTNESGHRNDTWYAIRCLPERPDDFNLWRFGINCPPRAQRLSPRDLQLHLRFNRQYNLTLRQRIARWQSVERGLCDLHSHIVSDMSALGRNLIAIACFQLATNVGSGAAMNPVPIAGELAGRIHAGR